MTFEPQISDQAFVWIWLPGEFNPIVAGLIKASGDIYQFRYAKSYLSNPLSIPLSPFELPLQAATFTPTGLNKIHSCLRDAAPDAWGRRVINNQFNILEASELYYMLNSGSNRIGGLDFQFSSSSYEPRNDNHIELKELMSAAEYVEKNLQLPKALQFALLHGTSIGGARPKALLDSTKRKLEYIAKFSSTTDIYNIIKAEYIGMRLAKLAGINVANVSMTSVLKKDVLLVERFDRLIINNRKTRKLMLSALSILSLNELEARYASYVDFADIIRQKFSFPQKNLEELFKRLVFNVLIGNNDDHARNHAAFWDGKHLTLTPAYDICPQPRVGFEATQAMLIGGKDGNLSKISNVLSVCHVFQLDKEQAKDIIESMVQIITKNWELVCEEARLSSMQKNQLWHKSILNPLCLQ